MSTDRLQEAYLVKIAELLSVEGYTKEDVTDSVVDYISKKYPLFGIEEHPVDLGVWASSIYAKLCDTLEIEPKWLGTKRLTTTAIMTEMAGDTSLCVFEGREQVSFIEVQVASLYYLQSEIKDFRDIVYTHELLDGNEILGYIVGLPTKDEVKWILDGIPAYTGYTPAPDESVHVQAIQVALRLYIATLLVGENLMVGTSQQGRIIH